jgi:hypothetical protein
VYTRAAHCGKPQFLLQSGALVDCPSIFGQNARHVPIEALRKRDMPKFETFSEKKGLKKQVSKYFGRDVLKKNRD